MTGVVLVTGAGRGIGAAIARERAARGHAVACVARSANTLDEIVDAIVSDGGRALAVPADVTDADRMAGAVAETVAAFGGLDTLVCAAGVSPGENPIETTGTDVWRACVEVNLIGSAVAIAAAVPELRRGGGGRILVLGSGAADRCPPGHAAYSASKAGVHALVRTVARELAGDRIAVNELRPGATHTELLTHGGPAGAGERLLAMASRAFGEAWLKTPDSVAEFASVLLDLPVHGTTGQTFTLNKLE